MVPCPLPLPLLSLDAVLCLPLLPIAVQAQVASRAYWPVPWTFSMPQGQGPHGSGKRTASLRVVQAKRAKINADWASLSVESETLEQQHMISEIVHMLQMTPEQIKGCWQAVKGNTFVKAPDFEQNFPETYVYLTKVPKYFLKEWFVVLAPALGSKLDNVDKIDKFAYLKIMYRSFLVESSYKFPSKVKSEFKTIMMERYVKAGSQLGLLAITDDHRIAWETCGVYKLLPERPADKEGQTWEYSSISFNGTYEVPHSICSCVVAVQCFPVLVLSTWCLHPGFLPAMHGLRLTGASTYSSSVACSSKAVT